MAHHKIVDMHSGDGEFLEFIESHMIDKSKVCSNSTRIADAQWSLEGRQSATRDFRIWAKSLIKHTSGRGCDINDYRVAAFHGMSGVGKTRMLEEAGRYLAK
jgi:hypothetical protein